MKGTKLADAHEQQNRFSRTWQEGARRKSYGRSITDPPRSRSAKELHRRGIFHAPGSGHAGPGVVRK